jgi:S1-C subfamily serine protease
LIQQIEHGSPAHEAGLKGGFMPLMVGDQPILAGGDIILSIDGTSVPDLGTLGETLSDHQAGDELTLRLLRDNEEIELSVTLWDRPE